MTEENEIKMSPLCQSFSRDGLTVHINIFEDNEGGWLLKVVDEYNNTTLWDDSFKTDKDALNEAIITINAEGIDSFTINSDFELLH